MGVQRSGRDLQPPHPLLKKYAKLVSLIFEIMPIKYMAKYKTNALCDFNKKNKKTAEQKVN